MFMRLSRILLFLLLFIPSVAFGDAVLESELLNDPLTRGYSGMTVQQIVDDLNTSYRTRNRTTMTGREVANEVVNSEYDALTDTQKSQFLALIASEDLDPFGLAANVVKDIFVHSRRSHCL